MRIYYMNDEQAEVTVRVIDANYDVAVGAAYHRLQPCEGRVFEIEIPANCIPYVKKWKGMVLLSYLDESVLESLAQSYVSPRLPASGSKD